MRVRKAWNRMPQKNKGKYLLERYRRDITLFDKNPRFELLGKGTEGRVYFDKKSKRAIKIFTKSIRNPRKFVKNRYYYHKIAHILFPGNVLKYNLVSYQKEMTPIIISDKIETSETHNFFTRNTEEKRKEHSRAVEKRHFKRMRKLGIFVDEFAANLDVIKEQPFVFEISYVNKYILGASLPLIEKEWGLEIRKKVEASLTRFIYWGKKYDDGILD